VDARTRDRSASFLSYNCRVEPALDFRFSTANVAEIYGGEVQPLVTIAAKSAAERAENFKFTDEDEELLRAVLAENGEHPSTDT
jgi:hypothetical protein